MVDHYKILGLSPDASEADIKSAYRRMAVKTHPDTGGSDELFKLVAEAHRVLADPNERAAYDRSRRNGGTTADTRTTTASGGTRTKQRTRTSSYHNRRTGPDPSRRKKAEGPRSHATVFGRVGDGMSGNFGRGRAAAGVVGEEEVADHLAHCGLPQDAYVFHDVRPDGGDGNVDHVVVYGNVMVTIDAKRWAPGTYVCDPVTAETWRDGQRFEPGDARSAMFLTELLLKQMDWVNPPTTFARVLAVSCSDYDRLNLDGYDHPNLLVVRADHIGRFVNEALTTATGTTPPDAIARLHAMTVDNGTMRTDVGDCGQVNPQTIAETLPPAVERVSPAAAIGLVGLVGLIGFMVGVTLFASTESAQAAMLLLVPLLAFGGPLVGLFTAAGGIASKQDETRTGALAETRRAMRLPPWHRTAAARRWGVALFGVVAAGALPVWVLWGSGVVDGDLPWAPWAAAGVLPALAAVWLLARLRHHRRVPQQQTNVAAGWADTLAHASGWRAPVAATFVRKHYGAVDVQAALHAADRAGHFGFTAPVRL